MGKNFEKRQREKNRKQSVHSMRGFVSGSRINEDKYHSIPSKKRVIRKFKSDNYEGIWFDQKHIPGCKCQMCKPQEVIK